MAKTYSELMQEVKTQIRQVPIDELHRRRSEGEAFTLVDVREKDEWRQGFIPGAQHIARGFLEMQAANRLPDKDKKVIVYCAGGVRSAFAAKTLMDLGYTDVESANPGFGDWKDKGYPVEVPFAFTDAQLDRYSRHLLLPEVGEKGQAEIGEFDGYAPLMAAIVDFARTGKSPVPEQETIESLAFMEADVRSKEQNGKPVAVAEILKQAGWKAAK